jgi:HSP20 family protein
MAQNLLSPSAWMRGDPNDNPLFSLHKEIDRLFGDFAGGFGFPAMAKAGGPVMAPQLDVVETDKSYEISVELPGVEEKDLDVSLAEGVLTIKGEKRYEKEDKSKNYLRVERSYGAFQRSIAMPSEVDEVKISAAFTNGVLKLTVPKKEGTKPSARKIQIAGNKK